MIKKQGDNPKLVVGHYGTLYYLKYHFFKTYVVVNGQSYSLNDIDNYLIIDLVDDSINEVYVKSGIIKTNKLEIQANKTSFYTLEYKTIMMRVLLLVFVLVICFSGINTIFMKYGVQLMAALLIVLIAIFYSLLKLFTLRIKIEESDIAKYEGNVFLNLLRQQKLSVQQIDNGDTNVYKNKK